MGDHGLWVAAGVQLVETLAGFAGGDQVTGADGFGQLGLDLFAGLALLGDRGLRVEAGVDLVETQADFAGSDQVTGADGFSKFGLDLFAGFAHGGGVGRQCVAGNEGGEGDGDNRETGFHDSFLGGG